MVSYKPPRYEYSYEFYIRFAISGIDYIDDMRIRMNRSTLKLETTRGFSGRGTLFSQAFDPMHYPEERELQNDCETVREIIECGRQGQAWPPVRSQVAAAPATAPVVAAPAAPIGWICECCGSKNTGKCCEGCGAPQPKPKFQAGWKCFCGRANPADVSTCTCGLNKRQNSPSDNAYADRVARKKAREEAIASELKKYKVMLDSMVISQEEYNARVSELFKSANQ